MDIEVRETVLVAVEHGLGRLVGSSKVPDLDFTIGAGRPLMILFIPGEAMAYLADKNRDP